MNQVPKLSNACAWPTCLLRVIRPDRIDSLRLARRMRLCRTLRSAGDVRKI